MWPNTASADAQQTCVYFTGTKKMCVFTHSYSSIVPEQKLTSSAAEKLPQSRAPPIQNFELNLSCHH